MEWKTIERPGYFGRKKDSLIKTYNDMYGLGNWRIGWRWLDEDIDFLFACHLYEDGYYNDSFRREDLWKNLTNIAWNVYDIETRDIESGFNYLTQKSNATHLQDIAIRRVIARRGWKFTGNKLIQIRNHSDKWGKELGPGKVPFHLPEHIVEPRLEKWWDKNSIEDFYQSNKVLQIKDN